MTDTPTYLLLDDNLYTQFSHTVSYRLTDVWNEISCFLYFKTNIKLLIFIKYIIRGKEVISPQIGWY